MRIYYSYAMGNSTVSLQIVVNDRSWFYSWLNDYKLELIYMNAYANIKKSPSGNDT